ncbi:armadillo-type protein [Mycena olivaceomarginata]|nr:armadillo-type protein [Mycena olivaceomarginata]
MGKAQKKKAMRRHNPMRVPDSHLPQGLASASETSSKTEAILPIIQKMQGTDVAERKWACVAVSNLIQNDPSTRRLLQGKNVVGALITRLTDSEEEVAIEALGALRNLCIDGGYDICAEMYNKSILVPLRTFVPKVSTTLSQYLEGAQNAPENAQTFVYEFADNLITVLWCLSETSNKALTAINEMKLTPFLMSFLAAREKIPLAPVTAAAQCLYVLTDDNYPAIADVRSDGSYIACLMSILTPDETSPPPNPNGKAPVDSPDPRAVTLRVLASGILRNISPIPPPSAASAVDVDKDIVLPQLQPVVSALSLPEASASALELISKSQQDSTTPNIEKLSLKNTPKTDHKSPAEIELERLEGRLRTVQLALEILTGACATLPDPEPETEGEVPTGANEEGDDDIAEDAEDDDADLPPDMDMAIDNDVAMDASTPGAPQPLPALVQPLLALIQPTTLSFPPLAAPSPHPPTTSALSAIHVAALECLNNIFLALARSGGSGSAADTAGGRAVWDAVWAALGAVGTQTGPGQERRRAMWEVAVGVLWGVASVYRGSLDPNPEHVRALMALCDGASAAADTDAQLRVKCIGTLECLAMSPAPASIEANATIAAYLLSMLPSLSAPVSPAGTEPMLQAAASLIDIYSDEGAPWDGNFRTGGYLERLAESVEGVKKAVRAIDRRKEGGRELRRRGEEVRDNLVAFVEYRRGLGL